MVHITDVKKASANVQEQFGTIDEAIVKICQYGYGQFKNYIKNMCRIVYIYNF